MKTNDVFYCSESLKILDLELPLPEGSNDSEHWDDLIHPEDREKYYSTIQKHFDKKTSYHENYHQILSPCGNYKWILEKDKVIERSPIRKPLRVIGTHVDVSFQKEKEFEL